MPQWNGLAGFAPLSAGRERERVHVVVLAARNVELFAAWGKTDAGKGIGDLQNLSLRRRVAADVVDEHILPGGIGNLFSAGPAKHVVAAGENEQGVTIRTYRRAHGLTRDESGITGQAGIERNELRAGRGRGSDLLSGGQHYGTIVVVAI